MDESKGLFYLPVGLVIINMRTILITVLAAWVVISLLSASSCSRSSALKTPEEKEREVVLKNRVKSVTETKISVFAGIKQPGIITQVREFDTFGFVTRETDYRPDSSIECRLSFEYNKAGKLASLSAVNSGDEFLYKVTRSYDAEDKLKELYFNLPGGTYKYRTVSTYDSKGRLTEYAWFWPTGFKAKNIYAYEGWNRVSDKEYDPQGRLNYEWTYRYDQADHLLEAVQVNAEGKISRRIAYAYNGDLLMKQTSFVDEEVQKSLTYAYDDKGLLASMTETNASGKITAIFSYRNEYWP